MMTIRRKTWTRIGLLLLLAGLVGWGMWAFFTRPEEMRLVATLPVGKVWLYGESPVLALQPGCLFMRAEPLPTGETRLTRIGWDGQPHWSVTTTLRAIVEEHGTMPGRAGEVTIASLSPDGHILALGEATGATLRIRSWRDGTPLGTALLPWIPVAKGQRGSSIRALWATDSGRVWVFDSIATARAHPFHLWAVDGARVASGRYAATVPWGYGYLCPQGTHYLVHGTSAIDYVTLAVQGSRIVATRNYSLPRGNQSYSWLDDTRLCGSHGVSAARPSGFTLLGPQGVLERGEVEDLRYSDDTKPNHPKVPLKLRLYDLAGNRSWPLRTVQTVSHTFDRTPDGRTVVVREEGLDETRYPVLAPLMRRVAGPRLAVYTAPGRLCAVALDSGLEYMVGDPGLSPDGHRAAYLRTTDDGSYQMRLYAWGER